MAYKAEVQKDIVAVSTAVPATTGKASMNPKKINEYFIIYVFICTNFWAEVQVKKGPFRTLIHALVPEIFNIGNIKRFLWIISCFQILFKIVAILKGYKEKRMNTEE